MQALETFSLILHLRIRGKLKMLKEREVPGEVVGQFKWTRRFQIEGQTSKLRKEFHRLSLVGAQDG